MLMDKSESKYFNTSIRFDKALLALMERKPFEYITIKEICAEAQVNRSTFYLHYENMADLLNEATMYVLNNFVSYFPAGLKEVEHKYDSFDLQELNFINDTYLYPYLSYIKENRRVFTAVLSQPTAFDCNLIFEKLFDRVFDPILDRFHYPKHERYYVMKFYLNGITAIVREWINDDCKKDMCEIAEIICYCVMGRNM